MVTARLSVMAFGFAAYMFLTRALGPTEYGLYGLAVTIGQWVAIVVEAFAGGATVQMVAGNRNGDRYAVTILRVAMVMGLSLAFALVLSAPWLSEWLRSPDLTLPLCIMAFEVPLMGMAAVHGHVLMARGRFRDRSFLLVGYWASRFLLSLSLVRYGGTAVWAAAALPFASMLHLVVGARMSGVSFMSSESVHWKSLLVNNRKRTSSVLLHGLFSQMDILAVQWWGGSSHTTGLYAAAKNLSNVANVVLNSGQSVVLPVLAQAHGRGDTTLRDRLGREFRLSSLHLGALIMALSILCFDGLSLVLGQAYDGAGPVAMVLLMGVGVRLVGSAGSIILNARGEKGTILPQTAAAIVLALACYRWLPGWLPGWPFMAVIASVLFAVNLAMSVFLLRELSLSDPTPWPSLLKTAAALAFAVSVGWLLLWNWIPAVSWLNLCILAGVVSTAFLSVLLILGEKPFRNLYS